MACLKRVDGGRPGAGDATEPGAEPARLLARCASLIAGIEARGPDRALLMDPGKMLAVYPAARRDG